MAVAAITPDYTGERLDRVENFHGKIVVYVGWDRHLMFCSPVAFVTPPDTTFGKVMDELIPGAFAQHPDFEKIDWDGVSWLLNGEAFTPDREATLEAQGVDHKSIIRLQTPGLDGIGGSHS
jgi:phenol hydroxylase P4 protein